MDYIVALNTIIVAVVAVIQLMIALDERRQLRRQGKRAATLGRLSNDS